MSVLSIGCFELRVLINLRSALLSPQLLELSGIGDKSILEKIGVPVQVDLPGVGANVQEHAGARMTFGECYKTASRYSDSSHFDT